MMPDYSKPVQADIIAKDDSFIRNEIESRQHEDIKSRIGAYFIGALTGLSGLLFARTKNADFKGQEDKLNAKIAELQQQLLTQDENLKRKIVQITKANKKNMVIVGILSAIGAGILTFAGTKKLANKKTDKKVKTEQIKDANPQTEKEEPIKLEKTTNTKQNLFSNFDKYVS